MQGRCRHIVTVLLLAAAILASGGAASSRASDLGSIVTEAIGLTNPSPSLSLIEGLPTDVFAPASDSTRFAPVRIADA
jgi:hypothetical protein